jgi:hypothetical protein
VHATVATHGERKRFSLPQDGLYSGILKIRRITVFAENSLNQNTHSRARTFSMRPINRDAPLEANE